jgi:hypothetical protein
MATLSSFRGNPYFFVTRRPFRQARLASYIHREHEKGRRLTEILEDRYVRRCGTREFVWRTMRETSLIRLLGEDSIAGIQRASEAVSHHE